MKKLLVLGLMISLFAFGGRKEEVKTTYAAEVGKTSAMFNGAYLSDNFSQEQLDKIVSIKVSNDPSDLPSSENQIAKITVPNCAYTDVSGKTTYPTDGVIFAYLSKISASESADIQYNCVLYADVDTIYAKPYSSYMFNKFNAVKTIDIEMLDLSQVTNMNSFFRDCSKLESVKFSKDINTSNVTDMGNMFSECKSLLNLDLSNFTTSKVTNMGWMFYNCNNLIAIDISNFDLSNVTNMYAMFYNCYSADRIDLPKKVTTFKDANMDFMFSYCSNLTELDLSLFDMSNVTRTYLILTNSSKLEHLNAPKSIKEGTTIELPSQFEKYCGVSTLSSANLAENEVLDITSGKFVSEWRTLRDSNNSICNVLVVGSAANTKFNELLKQYKTFDAETKTKVDNTIDYEDATIGETMKYLQEVMNGTQSTEKDYGYAKNDSGSFMTLSIKEESPYLVAVITLIGVLSIAGYYFYNKKRNAM